MRKNYILGASVTALGLGFLNMAQAQTADVVVDLSVLDNLSSSSATEMVAHPLFPVVNKSKAQVETKVKKAPTRKKNKSARKAVKAKAVTDVAPVVKVEVKAEEPVVEIAPVPVLAEEKIVEPKVIAPVANEIRPITEDEHIVVVDVEPVSPKQEVIEEQPKAEVVVDQPQVEAVEPVVEENIETREKTLSNVLLYENDVSDLTSVQQQQIDEIISAFDNPQQNKIAIFAYNLDDGVDSFKRKRLSLNRAVDVRSYLLQKGYKNFSIKVVNVNTDSDKINSVEITEMK